MIFKAKRRQRLRDTEPTAEQRGWMLRAFPPLRHLTPEMTRRLEGHTQVFLDEKRFEGVGIDITDPMRWTIATLASVLLLGQEKPSYFPDLHAIRIYPNAFRSNITDYQNGLVTETTQVRSGESSTRGWVVLSWKHVVQGANIPTDGDNVVFHEFAHQLDGEDGAMDGAPILGRGRYGQWAHVLGREFTELTSRVGRYRTHPHLAYAATNPAEFFAVMTEVFFEQSPAMARTHPELFEQMRGFYGVDPRDWA